MENSELKASKTGWLKNFLFGKKKKNPPHDKITCNCSKNVEGTMKEEIIQNNTNPNSGEGDLNTYSDAQKMQKNSECPGKIFLQEQRGCGFHLYFSINNGGRPNLGRNKKLKRIPFDKYNGEDRLKTDKGAIACRSDVTGFAGQAVSHQSLTSHYPVNISPRNINSRGKETSRSKTQSSICVFPQEIPKLKESEIAKGSEIITTRKQEDIRLTGKESSILQTTKPSASKMFSDNFKMEATMSCLTPLPFNSNQRLTVQKEVEVKNIDEKSIAIEPSKRLVGNDIEEALFREYQEFSQSRKSKRNSTIKSRGTLARNSFISLRKKKFSLVGSMIPEILSKLDHIEEKLTELEKVYEEKGKSITNIVGISCNNANCTSNGIENQEMGEPNKKFSFYTPIDTNPCKVQPVLIKSCGEDIFVKAPESVSIVKKIKNKQRSDQLIYHNTQELDAHNITSNLFRKTKSLKSHNLKTNSNLSSQPTSESRKKVPDMIWEKISEELKV